MIRIAIVAALISLSAPVLAAEAEVLRLSCRAEQGGEASYSFSIDTASGEAVETSGGRRYGVAAFRDGLALFDPNGGRGAVVFRIDRIAGRFARVDSPLVMTGTCTKAEPAL
ncbi:MAG: hypothetical protein HY985_02220 [Magnetospirillum sp.]|nr:hypothetical protein [Magnetospirillum sp.]